MPTKYKPTIDHKPLNWSRDIGEIEEYIISKGDAIAEALVPENGRQLDEEDKNPLLSDIILVLVEFAARCAALPLRSVNMLKATVQSIEQSPESFRECTDDYDPEVVCLVANAFAKMSTGHRDIWAGFELGTGPHPDPVDIRKAAQRIIQNLNSARKSGRTRDELQDWLALRLGEYFQARNGKITRINNCGEEGRFRDFLEIVLAAVRPHARNARSSLNLDSMVRHAQAPRENS